MIHRFKNDDKKIVLMKHRESGCRKRSVAFSQHFILVKNNNFYIYKLCTFTLFDILRKIFLIYKLHGI